MPFDPETFPSEVPTPKIDVAPSLDFTVEEFAAWVATKPADEEYHTCNARTCAAAQFGIATGRNYLVGYIYLSLLSVEIADAIYAYPHTFGAPAFCVVYFAGQMLRAVLS